MNNLWIFFNQENLQLIDFTSLLDNVYLKASGLVIFEIFNIQFMHGIATKIKYPSDTLFFYLFDRFFTKIATMPLLV